MTTNPSVNPQETQTRESHPLPETTEEPIPLNTKENDYPCMLLGYMLLDYILSVCSH